VTIDIAHLKATLQGGQGVGAFTAGKLVTAVDEMLKYRDLADAVFLDTDACDAQEILVRRALAEFHNA